MCTYDYSAEPAKSLLEFIDASPSPFHVVHTLKQRLQVAGFAELRERDDWSATCQPGGKYYMTRNASTIVAFAIGSKWQPGNPVAMIGAHTDSPALRLKPVSKVESAGYMQVGCELYGDGIWQTWFDRDLSLAGRIVVKTPTGEIRQRLVRIDRPVLRIPTLAVHFGAHDPSKFSKETELLPIAGLVAAEMNRQKTQAVELTSDTQGGFTALQIPSERHHSYLIELLGQEAKVGPADVRDLELVLYDTQKASIGGLHDEFIFASRLDNLVMMYCATEALIESTKTSISLENETSIRMILGFDHEEIGCLTSSGAASNLTPAVLRRLSMLGLNPSASAIAYEQSLASSFLISADMSHAFHPNYADRHEARHRGEMNQGTVLKLHANGGYASNSPGVVLLEEMARRAQVPLQLYVNHQDQREGSTIGPVMAAKLGLRTVDLGNAQLSMHSIRETAGVYDVDIAIRLFRSFFEHYSELEEMINID